MAFLDFNRLLYQPTIFDLECWKVSCLDFILVRNLAATIVALALINIFKLSQVIRFGYNFQIYTSRDDNNEESKFPYNSPKKSIENEYLGIDYCKI